MSEALTPAAETAAADPMPDAAELRTVLGQLSRKLRSQSTVRDYTQSQATVMMLIERDGPATVSELARAAGVRPQSMAATVAALHEAGFVEGAPDPTDGRKTLQSLTAYTRAQLTSGRLAKEDWLAQAMRTTLSVDEQQQLVACIPLLRRLADSP